MHCVLQPAASISCRRPASSPTTRFRIWACASPSRRSPRSIATPMAARLLALAPLRDYTIAIENLQAEFPGCTTVASRRRPGSAIRPTSPPASSIRRRLTSTARFQQASRRVRCLALLEPDAGLHGPDPDPQSGGALIYGGTPSDQSLVRCIRDLKARGLRVVFYPFILMTATGEPWRGRITFAEPIFQAPRRPRSTLSSAPRQRPRNSCATRPI